MCVNQAPPFAGQRVTQCGDGTVGTHNVNIEGKNALVHGRRCREYASLASGLSPALKAVRLGSGTFSDRAGCRSVEPLARDPVKVSRARGYDAALEAAARTSGPRRLCLAQHSARNLAEWMNAALQRS